MTTAYYDNRAEQTAARYEKNGSFPEVYHGLLMQYL